MNMMSNMLPKRVDRFLPCCAGPLDPVIYIVLSEDGKTSLTYSLTFMPIFLF